MTTVSPKPAPTRKPPSTSPTPTSIARGATARSAVSPRVTGNRRSTTKVAQTPLNEHAREALVASLKQETDQKEQLLVQLQTKDQTISSLTDDVENLTSALHTTETRLNELYTEQARSETELAQRIEVAEKLRTQVRELEKEKRDLQRRYNEQTTTFEAERQAFYDNEQHLKSRIQSLSEALKRAEEAAKEVLEPEYEVVKELETQSKPSPVAKQDINDPENEPAEMTALKLELSTLSTSYSSLQSTLLLLQSQLLDLKRVNNELQEDNESYMILLREKTLNGQFDPMRQVGTNDSTSDDEDNESDDNVEQLTDVVSLRSTGRSTLDRVDEEAEGTEAHVGDGVNVEDDLEKPRFSRHSSRQGRKRTGSTHEARGESLADLPITGPGLDLAAELGRAENKDILEGTNIDDQGIYSGKPRRNKKGSDGRKVSSSTDNSHLEAGVSAEMETMRSEIKSLKDANKALSLYASKIIDRIIAQEGFEHVLAADYDKEKASQTPSAPSFTGSATKQSPAPSKPRPQSLFSGKPASLASTPTVDSRLASPIPTASPRPLAPNRANRRSLSFDWKAFSIFNNTTEKKPDANLRPLTLKPGTSTLSSARKLDTEEDDEDRRERERLNATMKLMGIQPAPQSPVTPIERSQSDTPATATNNRRFSLFGFGSKNTGTDSDRASVHSTPVESQTVNDDENPIGLGISGSASLTQEALERAEAENSLAALDAQERNLSAELAKGGGGGFTEIAPRQGRRSRRSVGGSGSTVWSAGMGAGDE